ncbi:glycerol-3-phosphate 1-O-acyltransferase PlsY [soil metagenome]
MSIPVAAILLVAFAYFCGALPFGYLAGKLKGIDIRQHGSGNIGATNVLRVLGKGIGIPVFALDMLKGLMPTLLAAYVMRRLGASENVAALASVFAASASVLGHNYTFWLGFKGGKGIATSTGALLGLAPLALLLVLLVWIVTFYCTRYVALASIVAAMVLPIAMAALMTWQGTWNHVLLGFGIVMGVLAVVRHRTNIQRMLTGTENRFERKKKAL